MSDRPRTLLGLLIVLVKRALDATAAIDADPCGRGVVSRSEQLRRILRLRDDLVAADLDRADCVAAWLPNWSDALC